MFTPSSKHLTSTLLITVLIWTASSSARAGSLYLPVQLSPEIEARIERLFVVANMAIIKRPIPIKQVNIALERAEKSDPALVSSIRRYLDRYTNRAGITHLSIEAGAFDGADSQSFNNRGLDTGSTYQISANGYVVVNDFIAVNGGGIAGQRDSGAKDEFLEGSFVSLGWDYLQADIGYRSHWLGPFQESDMLISSHASAMPGVTVSNPIPLPWLGIQYEFFLAQMSESDDIRSGLTENQRVQGNPKLAGFHLSLSPWPGFAIGANRLMQFGGADRDQSLSGFYNAFFNVKESENVGVSGNDFGNQLTSITTRYTFAGEFPISIYMEYAGEDTSLSSGIHLGNSALMFGIHLPKLTKHLDFTWETAEWQNGWYVNGNYGDGLTNHNSILGHWGASQRVSASGASAQTAKLIWDVYDGKALSFKYQSIENKEYRPNELNKAERLTIEYAQGVGNVIAGVKLESGRDIFGESFNKLSGFVRW